MTAGPLQPGRGTGTADGPPSPPRVFRLQDGSTALGLAAAFLAPMPAFARLGFGGWTSILIGAINRGHYLFVGDEARVRAFACWAHASAEDAERWTRRQSDPTREDGTTGDCLIINAWAATDRAANATLLAAMRRFNGGRRIYARRDYASGRTRPVRLPPARTPPA